MVNRHNTAFFCIAIGLLVALSTTYLFAQQDSVASRKGLFYVNAGIGYSPSFNGVLSDYFTPTPILEKIREYQWVQNKMSLLGATVDYMVSNKTSLGLAYSYQKDLEGDDGGYNINNIIRQNIAVRVLLHVNKQNRNAIDTYIGIRTGLSCYIDNKVSSYYYFLGAHLIGVPSFQLLFGLQYYFSKYVGAHFEIGIGSPYLAEAGLSMRFGKYTAKKK